MTFLRYIVIQLLAYGIDMGMFWLMLFVAMIEPVGANVVAKLLAGIFAFVSHRHVTFRVAGGVNAQVQAIRYFVLLAMNLPFASVILALLLHWISGPFVAKFIADVICVGLTYLLSKYFVFAKPRLPRKKARSIGADL
ncbi:MAG: GtrA family protein [Betaproteobacteria bacterium]|nr:GtrA family protein [Betaproteobacteria bacterium]